MTPYKSLQWEYDCFENEKELGLKLGNDVIITLFEDVHDKREIYFIQLGYKIHLKMINGKWEIKHEANNDCRPLYDILNHDFKDINIFYDFMHDVELLTQLCTKPYDELKLYLDSI